jgi:transcriptional regulator with XRE-family HTH domain
MPKTATSALGSQLAGTAVRSARTRLKLTQAELGARLGASGPYIANIEAGRENLTVGQLAAIADVLGCELNVGFATPDAFEVSFGDSGRIAGSQS